MFRTATEDLINWKNSKNKRALLVTGARQIGKTYLIRQFAREHYKNFIELNFLEDPKAREIFDGNLDAQTILMLISAYTTTPFEKGNTLFFFDEIQECPNARTAIKFLVEDGQFDFIESGSLLGVSYKAVPSYPVGFEETFQMYPMDFEEFCIATGVKKDTLSYLKECYEKGVAPSELIHNKMQDLFKYYIIVGGMPEVVSTFIESHDIGKVIDKQKDIIALYRQDISKYSKKDKAKITNVFDRIPSELEAKTRRFNLASIDKNARLREYEDAFVWLKDAGVALPCYNLNEIKIPLKINEQSRLFKLFLCDTGLLCAMCLENVQFEILKGNLSINMGGILENVFAQLLAANRFSLRYYNKQKIGEVDFVIQKGSEILPIEIKSVKSYKQHAALDNVIKVTEWKLSKALVFCQDNLSKEHKITYLPWYMVMFLAQDAIGESLKVELDVNF